MAKTTENQIDDDDDLSDRLTKVEDDVDAMKVKMKAILQLLEIRLAKIGQNLWKILKVWDWMNKCITFISFYLLCSNSIFLSITSGHQLRRKVIQWFFNERIESLEK